MGRIFYGSRTKKGIASITNKGTIYGIMPGLAPTAGKSNSIKRHIKTHSVSNQVIPEDPYLGLEYMKGDNPEGKYLLSKNPVGSGGIHVKGNTARKCCSRGSKVTTDFYGKPELIDNCNCKNIDTVENEKDLRKLLDSNNKQKCVKTKGSIVINVSSSDDVLVIPANKQLCISIGSEITINFTNYNNKFDSSQYLLTNNGEINIDGVLQFVNYDKKTYFDVVGYIIKNNNKINNYNSIILNANTRNCILYYDSSNSVLNNRMGEITCSCIGGPLTGCLITCNGALHNNDGVIQYNFSENIFGQVVYGIGAFLYVGGVLNNEAGIIKVTMSNGEHICTGNSLFTVDGIINNGSNGLIHIIKEKYNEHISSGGFMTIQNNGRFVNNNNGVCMIENITLKNNAVITMSDNSILDNSNGGTLRTRNPELYSVFTISSNTIQINNKNGIVCYDDVKPTVFDSGPGLYPSPEKITITKC